MFSNFYELGDSNLQNAYLRGLIEKEDTEGLKRQRYSYFVSTKELKRVEVCHHMLVFILMLVEITIYEKKDIIFY